MSTFTIFRINNNFDASKDSASTCLRLTEYGLPKNVLDSKVFESEVRTVILSYDMAILLNKINATSATLEKWKDDDKHLSTEVDALKAELMRLNNLASTVKSEASKLNLVKSYSVFSRAIAIAIIGGNSNVLPLENELSFYTEFGSNHDLKVRKELVVDYCNKFLHTGADDTIFKSFVCKITDDDIKALSSLYDSPTLKWDKKGINERSIKARPFTVQVLLRVLRRTFKFEVVTNTHTTKRTVNLESLL